MTRIILLVLLHAIGAASIAQVPATNDECATAIPVTVSPDDDCTGLLGVTYFATQTLAPCAGTIANDVWFQFTATNTTEIIRLENLSLTNPVLEVFSGTCGSLSSIACHTAGAVGTKERRAIPGLTPGNSYYIRVYANSPNYGEFRLCIFSPGANDECANAIDVPVNTGLNWTTYTAANNRNNSPSAGNLCSALPNQADGWFKFVAQDTIQLIFVEPVKTVAFQNATRAVVYSGACGSLALADKVSSSGSNFSCSQLTTSDGYYILRNMTVGNTYYINVQQNISFPAKSTDSFKIAISNVPANDFITGALEIPVNANTTCTSTFTGNLVNSTPVFGLNPGCGDSKDVWFKFTATANRHLFAATRLTSDQPAYQVYYLNSGNLQEVVCVPSANVSSSFADLNSLTPGTEYYIRASTGIGYFPSDSFEICISTPDAIPANDDCSAAQAIPTDKQLLASTGGMTITAGNSSRCTTTSPVPPNDMWFSFTPTFNASAVLQFVASQTFPIGGSMGLELYTGPCGAQTRIACTSSNPTTRDYSLAFAAMAGTTYYLRIYVNGSSNFPFLLSFSQLANLPVTITDFKASYTQQRTVKLVWNTEEESRINYYEIERSINGTHFSSIARITARNISGPSEYTGEDLSPVAGVTYYRLKIVDQDGKVEYSKTVSMNIRDGITGELRIWRQDNFIMINNERADIKDVTLNIFTSTGQKIFSVSKRLSTGINPVAIMRNISRPLFIQVITQNKEARMFKVF